MAESTDTFLSPVEVAELTGIKTGKNVRGRTIHREQLQIEFLRTQGIPFIVNARGRPMIVRANLVAGRAVVPEQKQAWQPRVLSAA